MARSGNSGIASSNRGERGGELSDGERVGGEEHATHEVFDHEESGEDGAARPEHRRAGLLVRARVFAGTRAAACVSFSVAPRLDDGLLQLLAGRTQGVPVYTSA